MFNLHQAVDRWIDGAAERRGFHAPRGDPLLLAHKEHHQEPGQGNARYLHFTSLHNAFYTSTSDSLVWLGRKPHRTDMSKINVK